MQVLSTHVLTSYRIKKLLSGTAMAVLGRKHTVRLARFLLNEARYDLPNDMAINGEPELQRWVVRAAGPEQLVVLDIGANIGDWSASMLRSARAEGRSDLTLHAFEPAPSTASMLRRRLDQESAGGSVSVHEVAVADRDGEDVFFIPEPGAGTSSLTRRTAHDPSATEARVKLVALDTFVREQGLDYITLCKTDIEGHDISALTGAPDLLREQRVGVWQFEYNWRWIEPRHFLRDVFDIAERVGYQLGKITPHGIEFYAQWDQELESFREANYVLARADYAAVLPRVRWWGQDG